MALAVVAIRSFTFFAKGCTFAFAIDAVSISIRMIANFRITVFFKVFYFRKFNTFSLFLKKLFNLICCIKGYLIFNN